MLVVLDGLAGVDDSSVAGLELGIVVEGFADGLAFFDGGVNAFEGFGEAGFEGGLAPGSFGDERGELFVTGGFESDADLAEFGGEPVLGDPILFETGEFGLRGEDVIVFGLEALWTSVSMRLKSGSVSLMCCFFFAMSLPSCL